MNPFSDTNFFEGFSLTFPLSVTAVSDETNELSSILIQERKELFLFFPSLTEVRMTMGKNPLHIPTSTSCVCRQKKLELQEEVLVLLFATFDEN